MYTQKNATGTKKNYSIYVLLILLTIYSDSPLQRTFGFFGETMVPVFTLPVYCYLCLTGNLKINDKFLTSYKKLLLYVSVISVTYYLLFLLANIPSTLLGENILLKGIKLFIQFFTYYVYIKALCILSKGYALSDVLRPFYWGSILLTIILLIEISQIPYAFESLHYSSCPYWRIRLLGSEASYTSLPLEIFFVFSFLYIWYVKKSSKRTLILFACFVLQVTLSGSKTLLVVVLLIFIAIYWKLLASLKSIKSWIITVIAIAVIVFATRWILLALSSSFMNDIEEYSSTVTRFYSIFCGFEVGITHPFGVGFQSYLYYFPQSLADNKWIVNKINPNLNMVEIDGYIGAKSSVAVAAKSFLGQSSMYWGIFGTVYFVKQYIRLINQAIPRNRQPILWVLYIMSLILLIQLFFSSGLTFEILAFIFVLIYIKRNICFQ